MEVSKDYKFFITENIKKVLEKNLGCYFLVDIKNEIKVLILSTAPIKFDDKYDLLLCDQQQYKIIINDDELIGVPAGLYGKVEELLQQVIIRDCEFIKNKFKK